MKKNIIFLFPCFLFIVLGNVWGQNEKSVKDETPEQKIEVKKYTESELQNEIKKRLAKKMQEIKKGDVSEITFEVLQKEKLLNEREKRLKIREEEFEKSIEELNKQTKEFNLMKSKIIGCLDENKAKINERMDHIVSIMSSMRPQKASEVLSVQDENVSVKILSKLDSTKASKIFNLMDKEISARIQKQYLDMKK